jgi:UDP-N-acetylmuramoyl-L-alanyl-D-glutamate--2,6-diaminopimelate ligase
MEDYFKSKAILFTDCVRDSLEQGKKPVAAINTQDSYGMKLNQLLASAQSSSPSSFKVTVFHQESSLRVGLEGIEGELNHVTISSKLTGKFNASNLSGAVTLAQALNIPPHLIAKGVSQLQGVPGRLERVPNDRGIHIWVDYAHKADALEKVVKTLREIRGGHRLITVFGCGGDRDRQKRPVMGKIAVQYSDYVWITSDNPRTEEPMSIIHEILKGTGGFENFTVEVDRRQAIFKAIQMAQRGDLVLIAGKGHEDYQILGTQKVHFDDREVALDAFRAI